MIIKKMGLEIFTDLQIFSARDYEKAVVDMPPVCAVKHIPFILFIR
jgi:hypothetical protein